MNPIQFLVHKMSIYSNVMNVCLYICLSSKSQSMCSEYFSKKANEHSFLYYVNSFLSPIIRISLSYQYMLVLKGKVDVRVLKEHSKTVSVKDQ